MLAKENEAELLEGVLVAGLAVAVGHAKILPRARRADRCGGRLMFLSVRSLASRTEHGGQVGAKVTTICCPCFRAAIWNRPLERPKMTSPRPVAVPSRLACSITSLRSRTCSGRNRDPAA